VVHELAIFKINSVGSERHQVNAASGECGIPETVSLKYTRFLILNGNRTWRLNAVGEITQAPH